MLLPCMSEQGCVASIRRIFTKKDLISPNPLSLLLLQQKCGLLQISGKKIGQLCLGKNRITSEFSERHTTDIFGTFITRVYVGGGGSNKVNQN